VFDATGLAHVLGTLTGSCGDNPGIACRLTWDITHSTSAAQVVQIYLAGPVSRVLRIAFVIVLAMIVRAVAHRVINKITEGAATATLPAAGNGRIHKAAAAVHAAGMERREQRARALGSILRSGVSILVFGIAALTILGDLGVDLTPLLVSTTVLGVALGFGAQNLVRDYLSGILMLVEDHYGVGDTINVGDATGTVEAMSLLTTRLRDVNGVVWHIRNGSIDSVGNESQGWSRAVIDYPVPYGEDLARIRLLMEEAAGSLYRERGWRKLMLEKPEVWGAQELSSQEVTMRIVAKTAPMRQWEVARELRARVKASLDAAGVKQAGPETVVISTSGGAAVSQAVAGLPAAGAAGAADVPGADIPDLDNPGAGGPGAGDPRAAGPGAAGPGAEDGEAEDGEAEDGEDSAAEVLEVEASDAEGSGGTSDAEG
jgi:small-conductance mechanosensitive channel